MCFVDLPQLTLNCHFWRQRAFQCSDKKSDYTFRNFGTYLDDKLETRQGQSRKLKDFLYCRGGECSILQFRNLLHCYSTSLLILVHCSTFRSSNPSPYSFYPTTIWSWAAAWMSSVNLFGFFGSVLQKFTLSYSAHCLSLKLRPQIYHQLNFASVPLLQHYYLLPYHLNFAGADTRADWSAIVNYWIFICHLLDQSSLHPFREKSHR